MKKLSQKQKLIGFIAILIVAVILAIVITKSIIKNNNQVANESYAAITANASSNLIANYILNGITIGGITGKMDILDTNDATALPDDIAWGETAYVKGEKIIGTKIITIAHAKAAQKTFEENTALIDDYGNRVKVPEGFKIAEDSATSVTGGVVIEDVSAGDNDTKGSQFVWVPVGNVLTDKNGSKTTITLGRYTFNNSGTENLEQSADNYKNETILIGSDGRNYRELLKSSTAGNSKALDIEDFIYKTKKSRGYYIGRYEAGDATAMNNERKENDNNSNPVTCKKNIYPYTWVNQLQAVELSTNMYSNNNFKTDLINSYAWDTAIIFIQKFSGDVNYSKQSGINTNLQVEKCGESILKNIESYDEKIDVRCNIYDMAGNTFEWTTENCTYQWTSESGTVICYPCTARGGNCDHDYSTSSRNYNAVTDTFLANSFRIILYF